jgi:hypothetical protein
MSHTLGICEERAEKEETSEYQAHLPRLLGVFSVRFPLNLKILVITAGEKKNVVWTQWLTRIKMAKLIFSLNSLACTVHLECHST